MKLKIIAIDICILAGIVLLAVGCNPTQATQNTGTKQVSEDQVSDVCKPARVAIIQDDSGSKDWTGTPTLKIEDLEPLIDLISYCGGEIGFGLITENSNRGLVRLTMELQPMPPTEPSKEGNPFKVAKKYEAYQSELNEFNKQLAVWQEESARRINKFNNDVNLILKEKTTARKSDVWDAIRRADLFISEDFSAMGDKPRGYTVLITDGQDNVNKEKVRTMKSSAKVLLVNASGSIGALESLNPSRFESIESALRFIIADTERGN